MQFGNRYAEVPVKVRGRWPERRKESAKCDSPGRKYSVPGPQSMIRKLKSGQYRLYSRKKNAKTGKRRNLGTFSTREAAEQHERDIQFFKRR